EARVAVESELADHAGCERAAFQELHLILEELHALEVGGRRDHLGDVGHLRRLVPHVQHRLGGPAALGRKAHQSHEGHTRRGESGHGAPATPQHHEDLAQLGLSRLQWPGKKVLLRICWQHARQPVTGDLEVGHDQNTGSDRPAPTRTTLVRIQYPAYGTIFAVEAGTETTSPPSRVRSFASPSRTASTSRSMPCLVPPGPVRQTTTPCRSAGNIAPPAAVSPPIAVVP